jgi:tetratricopeptide (TPR) repeat protein
MKVYDAFLLGFFTDFLNRIDKLSPSDLKEFCRVEALNYLNKFDECLEYTKNNPLMFFSFKLSVFEYFPKFYNEKFLKVDNYFEHFKDILLKEFYDTINKDKILKSNPLSEVVICDIFVYMLDISNQFFESRLCFPEYLKLKKDIFNWLKQMEQRHTDSYEENISEENKIWKALIFERIGTVYSYYDKNKEKLYYELSLSCKPNVFALNDIINFNEEDNDEEAWNYLECFKKQWNYFKPIEDTEYYPIFNSIADLGDTHNITLQEQEKYYLLAIKIVEQMKYKAITESYPFYNLALLLEERKDFKKAEFYLKEAKKILEQACDIKIANIDDISKLLYFIDDFQDYLYELCKCQIYQKQKKSYEKPLSLMEDMRGKLDTLSREQSASINYYITLLKSKIYDIKKDYDEFIKIIEDCLKAEEGFLSKKQKSDLKSRLAYGYFNINAFDKYYKLITEAIDLDPENEYILKLLASLSFLKEISFLSKDHRKELRKSFIISAIILMLPIAIFFNFCIFLIFRKKDLNSLQFDTFLQILNSPFSIICFILAAIVFLIAFIRPIISKIEIKGIGIQFKEYELPSRERKSEYNI